MDARQVALASICFTEETGLLQIQDVAFQAIFLVGFPKIVHEIDSKESKCLNAEKELSTKLLWPPAHCPIHNEKLEYGCAVEIHMFVRSFQLDVIPFTNLVNQLRVFLKPYKCPKLSRGKTWSWKWRLFWSPKQRFVGYLDNYCHWQGAQVFARFSLIVERIPRKLLDFLTRNQGYPTSWQKNQQKFSAFRILWHDLGIFLAGCTKCCKTSKDRGRKSKSTQDLGWRNKNIWHQCDTRSTDISWAIILKNSKRRLLMLLYELQPGLTNKQWNKNKLE